MLTNGPLQTRPAPPRAADHPARPAADDPARRVRCARLGRSERLHGLLLHRQHGLARDGRAGARRRRSARPAGGSQPDRRPLPALLPRPGGCGRPAAADHPFPARVPGSADRRRGLAAPGRGAQPGAADPGKPAGRAAGARRAARGRRGPVQRQRPLPDRARRGVGHQPVSPALAGRGAPRLRPAARRHRRPGAHPAGRSAGRTASDHRLRARAFFVPVRPRSRDHPAGLYLGRDHAPARAGSPAAAGEPRSGVARVPGHRNGDAGCRAGGPTDRRSGTGDGRCARG